MISTTLGSPTLTARTYRAGCGRSCRCRWFGLGHWSRSYCCARRRRWWRWWRMCRMLRWWVSHIYVASLLPSFGRHVHRRRFINPRQPHTVVHVRIFHAANMRNASDALPQHCNFCWGRHQKLHKTIIGPLVTTIAPCSHADAPLIPNTTTVQHVFSARTRIDYCRRAILPTATYHSLLSH